MPFRRTAQENKVIAFNSLKMINDRVWRWVETGNITKEMAEPVTHTLQEIVGIIEALTQEK